MRFRRPCSRHSIARTATISMKSQDLKNSVRCAMAYLSPRVTKGEKDTLRLAEWKLYDYVFEDNTFRNDSASVMRWFNQWVFDVNYAALAEG